MVNFKQAVERFENHGHDATYEAERQAAQEAREVTTHRRQLGKKVLAGVVALGIAVPTIGGEVVHDMSVGDGDLERNSQALHPANVQDSTHGHPAGGRELTRPVAGPTPESH